MALAAMRNKVLQIVALALAATAVAWVAWQRNEWLGESENNAWAWRARTFAAKSPSTDKIKIILLDQASLDWGAEAERGWSWPWPRQIYAALLDFVMRAQPKAVAFDVLFTEPSQYGVEDDESFGEAIRRAPGFIAAVFTGNETQQTLAWPDWLPRPEPRIEGIETWLTPEREQRVAMKGAAFAVPEIAKPASHLGNVSDQLDRDGVYRRANLFTLFDGNVVPTLGFAAYLAGHPEQEVRMGERELQLGDASVPLDAMGRVLLRFRGHSGTHPVVSAAAVIQSELRMREGQKAPLDPEMFRDSYVLFGFSAPGLKDLRPTPVEGNYPGVEIHATLLDNLLERDALADAPAVWVVIFTLLLALAGAAGTIASRRAWQSVAVFVVLLPIPWIVGAWAYQAGWWWPILVGEVGVALALVGGVIVNYATEGRQKRFIKSAFKQYLGEAVIDEMIADPSKLSLGGERKELTMFFSDLEKFSSFSEKLEPTQLIDLLNVYLSKMGRVLMEEGGYVDKYIGDAIVAFWNAPVPQSDHARRAIRAALRCQQVLREQQAELSAMAAGMPVRMRIGLNTGDVVIGNMGSQERFNYTMLGDAANLASRLEGANKAFGTYLLVSESTWRAAGDGAWGRELGAIRVVGRKTPVRVFEPLALTRNALPNWLPDYEAGLQAVSEKRWADAIAQFEKLPDDAASRAYVRALRKLASGEESDWDGVWNLTEK
ncbi:MAG: adenylate/guanylate cyclase domain-containing protein [Verrucomicrobia bacterium]|nr:adenylate/guanylate cyclase domain-containing protein [Verrucomicrobiota bacterium]